MTATSETITQAAVQQAAAQIAGRVHRTPVWKWPEDATERRFDRTLTLFLKLELFQKTGSFKPRGALLNLLALDADQLARGVTAVSAGNHAAAVAWAASEAGTTAKVVMPESANPMRLALCRQLGAEVELVEDVHQAFERVAEIERSEGRAFIHPFEGREVALGTAGLAAEFIDQVCAMGEAIDVLLVPIGGGGLAAGMALAFRQTYPQGYVIGVEPEGANSMQRSLEAGEPQSIESVRTIADSLGAPFAKPYSFDLIQQHVDELVTVSDLAMCEAMVWLMTDLKLAVEPAAAATTAALAGPLRGRFAGDRVGTIICGANIDPATFCQYLSRASAGT